MSKTIQESRPTQSPQASNQSSSNANSLFDAWRNPSHNTDKQ